MKKILIYTALVFLNSITSAQLNKSLKQQVKSQEKPYHYFENPAVCAGCHWDKFERFRHSQHSKAFTGDFFQKQLNDLVVASESFAPELKDTKDDCIGCHSPSAFLAGDNFHRECVSVGKMVSIEFLETMVSKGIIRKYEKAQHQN